MTSHGSGARVALIGPVRPYRGGIAAHTTMLRRALVARSDVLTLSFRRQYPAWLYPGESDRDPAQAGQEEPGVDYVIDSLNPATWERALNRCLAHDGPVVLPWWTVYWAPCFGYLASRLQGAKRKVAFICHNVNEHEASPWKRRLTRAVLRQGSAFMVHSREEAQHLRGWLPDSRVAVYPHPIYDHFPEAKGTLPPRASLELLFYGFVRPYKGLDVLIEAMGMLGRQDVRLTVAGEFWGGRPELEARIRALGLEDRVELVPRYVSDAETAEYFARADAVVLPYRSATGSAVVPLAYQYGKPVVATRVGGLPDVIEEGETGWLVPPEAPLALAERLRGLTRESSRAMAPGIARLRARMSWEGLAEALLEAVE